MDVAVVGVSLLIGGLLGALLVGIVVLRAKEARSNDLRQLRAALAEARQALAEREAELSRAQQAFAATKPELERLRHELASVRGQLKSISAENDRLRMELLTRR